MSFKENLPPASLPLLGGFTVLAVAGPDAAAFLQAQTMNDVRDLAPRQWQWNGWLNAKGRVIALFALLRESDSSFLAILPDVPAETLAAMWQRYVFRSKVSLTPSTRWRCAAGLEAAAQDRGPRDLADGSTEVGWRLDWGGDGARRFLWLLPADHPALAPTDIGTDAEWRRQDLVHGLPRLADDGRERWTPQMLGLERLNAFSVRKGCYPGQEIVARTHFLGQAKRGLVGLQGSFPVGAVTVTDGGGRAVGELVCASPDLTICLAVLPIAEAADPLLVGGAPATPLALRGGLRRPA